MTAGSPSSSATTAHQPPAAERARTVAARPTASLYCLGLGISQLWASTTTVAGDVLLVVPTAGAVMTALDNSPVRDVPARLTVTDRTPFPLRHPVRGLLQLAGWVTPVDPDDVQRLVLDFADAYSADSLFDVGLSASLVRLDLAEVLLEEAGDAIDIEIEDFVAARPDAISRAENELMAERCDQLSRLSASHSAAISSVSPVLIASGRAARKSSGSTSIETPASSSSTSARSRRTSVALRPTSNRLSHG